MKKVILTIATAALFSVSVFAADGGKKGNEASANVSYSVLQEFTADFADAQSVVWTVNKNCQKADFMENGVKKTAFYSPAGDYIGLTEVIGYNAIPAKTQKLIADEYKDYTPAHVIVYQANEEYNSTIDPTSYFVDLKNEKHEILVRVTSGGSLDFFKQVK
jgi:hypothetical protein